MKIGARLHPRAVEGSRETFTDAVILNDWQIGQAVSRENHPSVSNPARTNDIFRRNTGSCSDHCAVHIIATPRNANPATDTVSDLRRNLEALFSPRLKVGARKVRRAWLR
jgi:hypothetical protein